MVGRLVQEQKVGLGKHQLGQGYTAFLASAQRCYFFIHIISAKKKGGQRVSDLCVVQVGIVILDFFEHRFFIMQNPMFLIVVACFHTGSEGDGSGRDGFGAVYHSKECGFSGPVITDNSNLFSPFDFDIGIGKERIFIKGFG